MDDFPRLTRGHDARTIANDAIVASLLAGEIAKDDLGKRNEKDYVGDLYSHIPMSGRLNRTVEDATAIVNRGEGLIASMAIPYVLSVHHRTMGDALALLKSAGHAVRDWGVARDDDGKVIRDENGDAIPALVDVDPYAPKLSKVHAVFRRASGAETSGRDVFCPAELNSFNFARGLRNRLMHQGGIAGEGLVSQWDGARGPQADDGTYPADGQELWKRRSRRSTSWIHAGQSLELVAGDVFATLACSKELVTAAEAEVLEVTPAADLADIVVSRYATKYPDKINRQDRRTIRLTGFREQIFREGSKLTTQDLDEAYERYRSRKNTKGPL